MAVRSGELQSNGRPRLFGGMLARGLTLLIYGLTILLVLLAAYALIGVVVERARILADDWRYGRPRTTHLAGFVGHGETRGVPTNLTAINLDRRVVIIELPGGDPSAVRAIEGPYLFGATEALTPIELHLRDMDADGTPDLLVTIRREQVVYLNKDGVFRLPTPDEQAVLNRAEP